MGNVNSSDFWGLIVIGVIIGILLCCAVLFVLKENKYHESIEDELRWKCLDMGYDDVGTYSSGMEDTSNRYGRKKLEKHYTFDCVFKVKWDDLE